MKQRSRLPMLLTELVIMLLVSALCAAVCLSIFASARATARESGDRGNAANAAQSAAAAYTAAHGDAERAAALIGAEATDEGFTMGFDAEWNAAPAGQSDYTLSLTGNGGSAEIVVYGGGEEIFSLEVEAVIYG